MGIETNIAADSPYAIPVTRTARFVSAHLNRDDDQRVIIGYAATEKAIFSILEDAADYNASIIKAAEGYGFKVSTQSNDFLLKKTQLNRPAGAVVDFDEVIIENETSRFIMRVCVTACVDMTGEIVEMPETFRVFPETNQSPRLYSKFWVRLACDRFNGSKNTQLDIKELRELEQYASDFTDHVVEQIEPIYGRSIARLIGKEPDKIEIRKNYRMNSLIVTSYDSEVGDALSLAQYRFEDSAGLESGNEPKSGLQSFKDLKVFFDDRTGKGGIDVLPVTDGGLVNGLIWIDVTDQESRLVGLAHKSSAEGSQPASSLRDSPSSTLGILATNSLASLL